MAKVIIDAGHGGFDNGASYNGRREKDDNLDLALAIGEILTEGGVEVAYTRVEDVYQSPAAKAELANLIGGDYLISIHRNSSPEPNRYSGAQILLFDENGSKAEMAENILEQLEQVGFSDLGISLRQNLAVLRKSRMPALLLEVGFINNDADNALLDAYFETTVQAIADGIMESLRESGLLTQEQSTAEQTPVYRVQVGLYRNKENAIRQQTQLAAKGYTADISRYGELYAVRVGKTGDLQDAIGLERILKHQGYDTLLVTEASGNV